MKYQDVNGDWQEHPATFSNADLDYLRSFLGGERTLTMHELFKGDVDPTSIVVRHDVDHSLEHAMKFARWEARNGFKSTYFVLHSAWYYRDKETLYAQMRELQTLGHEVGLHIDAYGQFRNWSRAVAYIQSEITNLRMEGFNIRGLAAHGGTAKHNDLELFESGEYVAKDFYVDYEAYTLVRSLDSVNYISDNHGRWRSPLVQDGRQTVILCHPCHWPLNDIH